MAGVLAIAYRKAKRLSMSVARLKHQRSEITLSLLCR